jgi:hypothetical protein
LVALPRRALRRGSGILGVWTSVASLIHLVFRLGPDRAAVVAMACAQRLADRQDSLDADVASAIDARHGSDREALNRWAGQIERRLDADDDYLTATVYTLRASLGSVQDAWWAVNRLIDAAFELADSSTGLMTRRSLENEAAQSHVRNELDWLDATLSIAEASDDVIEIGRQLGLS